MTNITLLYYLLLWVCFGPWYSHQRCPASKRCPAPKPISQTMKTEPMSINKEGKESIQGSYGVPPCACGAAGEWTRVAYLNMADPNQQCPSNLTLVTTPIRGCGRSSTGYSTCDSVTYSVSGRTYSSICGRVFAYQKGIAAAFSNFHDGVNTIDTAYVSGISLTYGLPGSRQHIWTFAAANEQEPNSLTELTCPCSNKNVVWPYQIPPFIGRDYFCDTGNSGPGHATSTYYSDDPLWDGKGCGLNSTCCEFNTPPWFCKSLPQPSSNDLELRLCNTFYVEAEDKLISLVDIHVK